MYKLLPIKHRFGQKPSRLYSLHNQARKEAIIASKLLPDDSLMVMVEVDLRLAVAPVQPQGLSRQRRFPGTVLIGLS
ncbi:hypothetical protein M0657_011811 [Pyricularia oryzae]|nr:hypothetical protein M0657_011811 [Pyricularia oryzae]